MTTTLPPQGSHFEDGVRTGPIFNSVFSNSVNVFTPPAQTATPADTQAPGVFTTPMSILDIVPTSVSTTLLANGAAIVGAGYITLTTTSVNGLTVLSSYAGLTSGANSGPLLQLDCARNITITSTGNISNRNITVFGWDMYGMPVVEQITGPNTTTVSGLKAFYVIQGVYSSGTAANISIGVGNKFGLPYFCKNANYVGVPMWNNTADLGLVAGTQSAALAADPITTGAAGSSIVSVTVTSTAALYNGQFVTISGATTTDGITAAQLNITAPITIVDATHFQYVAMGNATAGGVAGGGAAVHYTPNTIGVRGTITVADQTSPATATTGDVRGTYTPTSNADGTSRLTINMYSASGDTRKFNDALAGSRILASNPIATTNTSATIVVTAPNHNLTTGESVTITGSATVATVTINGTWTITVVDQNSFSFTASSAANATTTGGGTAVTMTPYPGNLYQTVTSRYGYSQYSVALF